nr:ionotropic receptor 2 [Gregopimpla kuwanae]
MSYPTWLIFFRDETRIEDFFMEIYVPFDCTFMVAQGEGNDSNTEIITEVYQIDRDQELRHSTFGTWHPKHGITTPTVALYQRRNDLYGKILRVASIHDPPGSLIVRDENGQMIGLGGFFGGIMQLLEESMNCTVIYHESFNWGQFLDNGTWTGAIGLLTRNDVDIVAAELMMTRDRLEAVDFTTPLYSTKCRTFIKRPSVSALKWDAYITPFHSGIWSSIGILIIVTSATISMVKTITPIISASMQDVEKSPSNLVDIILAVYGAFCCQGMEQSLLDPIRMVHQVIHLTGVVVLAAYSAALISSLATKTFVMPFKTMEGLLQDGTYRFGVIGESADYSFFQNTSDEILQVLFAEVLTKEKDLPNNYLDGLNRVCEEDKYAFMTLDTVVSQLNPKVNCKLEPLDTIMQASVAMAVRPRSPFRGIINTNILLIRDSGILQRLLHSEWALDDDRVNGWTTVEIGDILPLVLVILGGIFFSLITLGSERVIAKQKHRKSNKKTKEAIVQPMISFRKHKKASSDLFKH